MSTHEFFCSLESCKFHLILIGISFSEVLQRLDNYFYIYQEIDCLHTLYKHRFYSSIVTSKGKVFNQLGCITSKGKVFKHNLRWKRAGKTPSVSKKRLVREKFKKHYLSSNQKLASAQILGSEF